MLCLTKRATDMEYSDFTSFSDLPIDHWSDLLSVIPVLPFKVRKQLITMTRSRVYPNPGTRLYSICSDLVHCIPSHTTLAKTLQEVYNYPIVSGFLLSIVLSCPYTKAEVEEIKEQMIWKELSVMESVPRTPSIRWHILSDNKDFELHPHLACSTTIPRQVRAIFQQWFRVCQSRLIYPHSGTKSVSKETKRQMIQHRDWPPTEMVSTTHLEQLYSDTGLKLSGPCEMRQKWYPTQSSPRTYYAMGGDAYFRSRYLRNAINWLCDLFMPCHRKRRVRPDWIRVDPEEEVYIYDLSSFTSNMHEHSSFLNFLAELARGVEVHVFDTYEGILIMDLGEMIDEYNQLNRQPKYSMESVWQVDLELVHSVAGFLGVYANLMSATFPHSVVLSTVTDEASKSWCAGDDAGTGSSEGERIVHESAQTVGSLATEKVYILSETGAQALKRKVSRLAQGIFVHNSALWPAWSLLFHYDPRFDQTTLQEKRAKFSSAVVPFLSSVSQMVLTPMEEQLVLDVLKKVYQRLSLPLEGWLPILHGYSRPYTVPMVTDYCLKYDPLLLLAESYYLGWYLGPEVDGEDFTLDLLDQDEFICFSHPRLVVLERLGFVSSEKVKRVYEGEFGRDVLYRHVSGKLSKPINRYKVIGNIPSYLKDASVLE
jgi:hypothetical protein